VPNWPRTCAGPKTSMPSSGATRRACSGSEPADPPDAGPDLRP
jgi:hypothetical protein